MLTSYYMIYIHLQSFTYIYIHLFTHIYIHLHKCTYIYIHLHTFTYIYIYIYYIIYIHTFTYYPFPQPSNSQVFPAFLATFSFRRHAASPIAGSSGAGPAGPRGHRGVRALREPQEPPTVGPQATGTPESGANSMARQGGFGSWRFFFLDIFQHVYTT